MMRLFLSSIALLTMAAPAVLSFAPTSSLTGFSSLSQTPSSSSSLSMSSSSSSSALSKGDYILLIGPGFLQLNIAKAAKAAGLRPMVIADQKKLESFSSIINDDEIMKDSTYGMPEVHEPGFGEIKGVVFCAEEAVLGPSVVGAVLDYSDKGKSIYGAEGVPKRVVACAPLMGVEKKEKSMGWIPILNNDKVRDQTWNDFVKSYQSHPLYKKSVGSLLRFGSLLGGSVDGPDFLAERNLGLDKKIYKMSMEQYRDLKEISFDRFRLGAQVLKGNDVNPRPPNQDKMEKEGIKNSEDRESFKILGGYPEVDRANRHTVAQAVVESLLRPVGGDKGVPQEMTILSKSVQELPTTEEWDEMFANPGPASWPDPYAFDVSKYAVAE